jgi:hypothetical protein
MFANTGAAGTNFGAATQTTTDAGARATGVTGDTTLTAANLPIKTQTYTFTQNGDEDSLVGTTTQTATGHHHTVPSIPDHDHEVDMLPLSTNVIYLKRVW